ncbi:MAG: hypothetical protein ACRDJE_12640, partial [Dehalococcoidia bacterium]
SGGACLGGRSRIAVAPVAIASAIVLVMSMAVWSPPAARAQAPSCIVGTWVANDLESATQALAGADLGLEISELDGEFILTIAPDGSYIAEYNDVRFAASISAFSISGTLNGSITGTYIEASADTVIGTVSGGTVDITISLGGAPRTTSYEIPAIEAGPASYQCDGDQLTIALVSPDPDTTIPITFTRAG